MADYSLLVALDGLDEQLLAALATRLRCSRTQAMRWALRWYAIAGPWRSPDERLLAPLHGRIDRLEVGPELQGRDVL